MMKLQQVRVAVGVVVLLVVWAATSHAVAPPVPSGKLDRGQIQQLNRLIEKSNLAEQAEDFAEAIRRKEEEVLLRRRWQGSRHWRTINAEWDLNVLGQQSRMSAEGRLQWRRAVENSGRGIQLYAKRKYHEADPLLRKALAISMKLLGEDHPDTAASYINLASCLNAQGKYAQALPLYEKALAIRKNSLGDNHPATVSTFNGVAACLNAQGKHAQALPLFEKALAIRKRTLGDGHPDTATSYNNVALCINALGMHAQALPMYEKSLAIFRKALGENHPSTATSYNNVAFCLNAQRKPAQALPLYEKALAIRKMSLGEDHSETAASYNNVASCLNAQGKHAQALPLHEKALAIWRKMLGEDHPLTGTSYDGIATCLNAQGKHAQALPLNEKALAIRKKTLGEDHLMTATSYDNVASCLNSQGKHVQALLLYERALAIRKKIHGEIHPTNATSYTNVAACLNSQGEPARAFSLHKKALAIRKKSLGEDDPATATSYNNVATCLDDQGKLVEALPLYENALGIFKKTLGEDDPRTANSYNNLALCQFKLARYKESQLCLESSLASHDLSRFASNDSGFDRSRFQGNRADPRSALAVFYAHQKKPGIAWRHLEDGLARGLLEDLAGFAPSEDAPLRSSLAKLDERLLPLFGNLRLDDDQKALRDQLTRERRDLLVTASKRIAARSAGLVGQLADIQKRVPADTAIVVWVSALNARWACVVRSSGDPLWVQLSGTGPRGGWTADDGRLPARLHEALSRLDEPVVRRERLLADVRKLWFTPLADALAATKTLPAVRRLVVVPTGDMARIPVETLTEDYVVSYASSFTVFARAMQASRPLSGASLLALGDPVFQPGKASAVVASVVRGETYAPLPGTRFEVESLRRLVGSSRTTALLGSDASEAALADLAAKGKLGKFRLIHLATHGFIDLDRPERSALVLSRDRLPTREQALALAVKGEPIFDGHLRVDAIRRDWKLDADLVTLSACETALGSEGKGDGLLGFTQALLSRGARTVVLSRWKVNDTATALLMLRFYENLLGRDKKKPMPRAEALAEAKRWLRELPRKDAEALSAALVQGKLGSTIRGSVVVLIPAKEQPPKLPAGDKPFAHPAYWAAFILMGDPN